MELFGENNEYTKKAAEN